MICAAVFETDERVRELLREWMVEYLIQENRELNLLWFTQDVTEEKLEKYAKKISFAVISLDREEGRKAGELLYRLNPECRLAYYRCASCALEPLLPTRPSAFFLRKDEKGKEELQKVLGRILEELSGAEDLFFYEGRKGMYCIPLAHILYLQSDLKYVEVHTASGEGLRLFSRLSPLEPRLDGRFVRIHKSYIVNSRYVESVHKAGHLVRLSGGEALPVSDAWYGRALERLRALKAQEEQRELKVKND